MVHSLFEKRIIMIERLSSNDFRLIRRYLKDGGRKKAIEFAQKYLHCSARQAYEVVNEVDDQRVAPRRSKMTLRMDVKMIYRNINDKSSMLWVSEMPEMVGGFMVSIDNEGDMTKKWVETLDHARKYIDDELAVLVVLQR